MKTQEFDCEEGDCIVCETHQGTISVTVLEVEEAKEEVWLQIDLPPGLAIYVDGSPRETWGRPKCAGMPRLWLMFSLVLSGKAKREIFLPSFNEFVEDYVYAYKTYRGKWERRWLQVAFTSRSVWMVCTCFRIQIWGATALAARLVWKKLLGE